MKKFLSILLVLVLCVTMLPLQAAAYFGSPPDWAKDAYERMSEVHSWLTGYSYSIDRQDFMTLLAEVVDKLLPERVLAGVEEVPGDYFADVDGSDSGAYWILKAASFGITEGALGEDGLRYANPDNTITRQECAKMVCSTLDFLTTVGYTIPAAENDRVYTDQAAIANWASPFTGRVAGYGLMIGDQNGNFLPKNELDWPSAVVLCDRTMSLIHQVLLAESNSLLAESKLDWGSMRVTLYDNQIAQPTAGYPGCLYTAVDASNNLVCVVFPQSWSNDSSEFYVETFDAAGKLLSSKAVPLELERMGAFLAGWDGNYYVAFSQSNPDLDDSLEVWRVVKYGPDWTRLGSFSATGGETYTESPFVATVSRMDLSENGQLCLYAARERYDGHQSNITFLLNSATMTADRVLGSAFPANHVSHSFGQFVRYDGDDLVTVDHGDAYPRSFHLQRLRNGSFRGLDLLSIAGGTGQNVTHAIGSGLEVSGSGYLFLGCSAPQQDYESEGSVWNLFLAYTDKNLGTPTVTWLTHNTENRLNTARLVKVSDDRFVAMWKVDSDVHYLLLDGTGAAIGTEGVLSDTPMPHTQPVVREGAVVWFTTSVAAGSTRLILCSIPLGL